MLGVAAAANAPDSRGRAASWSDSNGNLWIFGGSGPNPSGSAAGLLNDLWKFSPSSSEWTWVNGSNNTDAPGVYGTQGTAAASNTPGARQIAAFWEDTSGNFWIFGGSGYTAAGNTFPNDTGLLNDLWMYAPATNLWTWMGGSTSGFTGSTYGTEGTASPQNIPGARSRSSYWTDTQGDFWLFGGYAQADLGSGSQISETDANDLWRYSPTTSQWTWMGGGQVPESAANYGVQGTSSPSNIPGGREDASSWVDAKGNFWLFGGTGFDSTGNRISLNDLWEYVPSTGIWTWVAGSSSANAAGTYGTQGTPSASTSPGARDGATSWTESSGKLLLFGGFGLDASSSAGELDDLWSFDTTKLQWTWVRGSNATAVPAVYGTLGTAATANDPGGRDSATSIQDSAGNLWLFGGYTGNQSGPEAISLNDLWKYTP